MACKRWWLFLDLLNVMRIWIDYICPIYLKIMLEIELKSHLVVVVVVFVKRDSHNVH